MKISSVLLLTASLAISVSACGNDSMQWDFDGSVTTGTKSLQTELQNAYTAFETDSGLYLGGFKIDQEGINHPLVVFVPKGAAAQKSWRMESSVTQFFEYNNGLYVLTSSGQALKRDDRDWEAADLVFKPDSIVVWAGDDVVACNPSPLLKSAQGVGGCYSLFKGWQLASPWRGVEPKVCDGRLIVLEKQGGTLQARQVDMATGRVINTNDASSNPADLCSIKF